MNQAFVLRFVSPPQRQMPNWGAGVFALGQLATGGMRRPYRRPSFRAQ